LLSGIRNLVSGEPDAPGPEIIAKAVLDAVTAPRPPVRHALPLDSKMSVIARWLLGARIFAWAVRLQMKFSR
ncbi:MAG TPA: short-chain dehydrogenase/reductase, partial [Nitrosospira sp.]|nr:short-chain dehydrogenase/reductase [Nitrosospira sp.]